MTVHAITMRRREHSSLHLNGIQTEMRRSALSKINVHDDTCVDRANRKKLGESDATELTGYWRSGNGVRHINEVTLRRAR